MIDYKSLLHRYIHHVGDCEGSTFMPFESVDHEMFTLDEIKELNRLDQERPSPLTSNPA